MSDATPRVNSTRLNDFPGRAVRLVGKVIRVENQSALLEASDHGQVNVKLQPASTYEMDSFVEVIGKVNDADASLSEYTTMHLGQSVDMSAVEAVVQLSNKLPDMFPSASD